MSEVWDILRGIPEGVPPPWVLVPMLLLATAPLTVLHELGHAAAALALTPGRVGVAMGRQPSLAACSVGRMTVACHPVMLPWRLHAGCVHDPASPAREAAIALAGPASSLLSCIVAASALVRVESGLVYDALFVMTYVALFTAVGNLVPLTFTDSRGARTRTDGAIVVDALRY